MAASTSVTALEMDANHLSAAEVEYELLARQVVPSKTDVLKRAQLRAVLANEKETTAKKLVQPGDFDTNVEQIKSSIDEIEKILTGDADAVSTKECEVLRSRIVHLQGRIAVLTKNASDKEKKDVVSGLSSDVLALQGLVLGHTEVLDEVKSEASTVGDLVAGSSFLPSVEEPVAGPSFLPKVVPVYKWNLRFSGVENRESLMSFLEKVEDLREARGLTEQQLFRSAHDLFTGFALQWYRNIRSEISSWEELVRALKRDFLPFEYELDLQIEIRNRTQGVGENVIVFIVAMESLYSRLDQRPTEQEIVRQIIRNLNPFFSQHLALQKIETLRELRDMCREIQEIKVKTEKYKPPPTRRSGLLEPDLACVSGNTAERAQNSAIVGSNRNNEARAVCWNCGKGNHRYGACSAPRKVFCFGCGRPEVYKAQCPRCSVRKNETRGSSSGNEGGGACTTSPGAEPRTMVRQGAGPAEQSIRGRPR